MLSRGAKTLGALWFALVLVLLTMTFAARAMEITDITGRTVTLDGPAKKVLLGEGRFLVPLSLLMPEDPVSPVAGMMNEFQRFDPMTYERYLAAFPALAEVPVFGATTEASVSVEKALMLAPDVAIFGTGGHGPSEQSQVLLSALEAAGIPVVFIDFRNAPLADTADSMRILGKVIGREDKAEAFAQAYEADIAKVTDAIAAASPQRPSVLLEARVGLGDACCFSIAKGMFADMIEAAGGDNIASDLLPGVAGTVNLEYVLANQPDIYIGTAIGALAGDMASPGRIVLGPGVSEEEARDSLVEALDRPGVSSFNAVNNGHAYGIWHHFYNSPFNAYAFQEMAVWLHPELFADLDPQATLDRLLSEVGPVDLSGTYAIGVPAETAP